MPTTELPPELEETRKRLDEVADEYSTQTAFAKALGWEQSRVSRALNPRKTSRRRLEALEGAVANMRFRNEDGDTRREDAEKVAFAESREAGGLTSYTYIPNGPGAGNGTVDDGVRQKISVNRAQIASHVGRPIPGPERAYWTSVEGTSMEPWLPNGTMILVEECGEITSGDRYVIWLGDTDANIVKRIERLSDDKLKVASDNPRHETRVYSRREADLYEDEEGDTTHIRVQGRVIYPPDTANSILSTVTEQLRKIHN